MWERFRGLLADERLPCALVDLPAFDANARHLIGGLGGKRLRIATKSLRCPALLERLRGAFPGALSGLMTYSAAESAMLAAAGWRDLLLAYPTARDGDADLIAAANRDGSCAVVIDDPAHATVLARAALRAGVVIPVVIEVDLGYRPVRGVHLGVRRSPLAAVSAVVDLARTVADTRGLGFAGVMGYEAHIAGLTDQNPFQPLMDWPARVLKRLSRPVVERTRADVVAALTAAGLAPRIVNGGGTGSLAWCAGEAALTEVTAGSGFLAGHLFDYYQGLALAPALYFALQVTRRPTPDIVTCHGGGYPASGAAGADRLPIPALPPGLALLPREGAGEVQTPLRVPPGVTLQLGDPVLFRPAKSGELAERFNEYLLLSDRLEARAPTYRGLGHCF